LRGVVLVSREGDTETVKGEGDGKLRMDRKVEKLRKGR
jgi:hypothetical protein